MAYPQMGNLYPSEGGFKTPQAYEAFLTSEGKTRAAYLAETDAFFAQLAENTRQFNENLGFKNKELASREMLAREGYNLQRELQDEMLEFEKWKTEQYVGVENKKINQGGMNYLGGPSRKDLIDLAQKNFDARYGLNRGTSEGGNVTSNATYKGDYSLTPGEEALARSRAAGSYGGSVEVEPGWYRPSRGYEVSDYGQGGSPRASGVSNTKEYYDWYA